LRIFFQRVRKATSGPNDLKEKGKKEGKSQEVMGTKKR
jgi:hypothetical protein